MNTRLQLILLPATLSLFSIFGCSSLYYYPDDIQYVDRTKLSTPPEEIFFTSEDGTQLHGWLFTAKKPQPNTLSRGKALVLHFHGNAQNLSSHFMYLYQIIEHGYDYFIFDYRGYGKSAGEPSPKGVVMDGRSALRWAATRAREHKQPLRVFAQSLGGIIALRALEDLQDEWGRAGFQICDLTVDSSFLSFRSVARDMFAKAWLTWPLQPLAWFLADNSQSPSADLYKLKGIPKLIVHGDQDRIVRHWLGQDLYEALPEPKNFLTIPGGRHTDFMTRPQNEEFYKRCTER